ncbi:hypothetical protein [Pseudoroseicyclus sp. CXY001]|uniref:hypothetical protein n=1 Tax=Pseudoroseicyclus sp. CXY001 TaxID=3242492 RepID=UPI00357133C8
MAAETDKDRAAPPLRHWPPRQPVRPLACVTMARNEAFFLEIWARYYLGEEPDAQLYILDHASSEDVKHGLVERIGPAAEQAIHVVPLPDVPFDVEYKAAALTAFANTLVHCFAQVIASDADEIVLTAPGVRGGLMDVLGRVKGRWLRPLGYNFQQIDGIEAPFDPARPLLEQRSYGTFSSVFTKPAVWRDYNAFGPGQHRSQHRAAFTRQLVLAHLKNIDAGEHNRRAGQRREIAYSDHHWGRGYGRQWRGGGTRKALQAREEELAALQTYGEVAPGFIEELRAAVADDVALVGATAWSSPLTRFA